MAKEKKQDSGWQFPKALEIVKCKEGNKEFMKERPARRSARKTNMPLSMSDTGESGGVIQYIGDGAAAYPVTGLPALDKESLLPIFDVPEKQREDWFVQVAGIPSEISFEDMDANEKPVEREAISIAYSGKTLKPLQTRRGLVFIESRYLSPVSDILDVLELYERITPGGTPYIVAKAGFLLQAVIMPYDVISQQFVDNLKRLTEQCVLSLDVREREKELARAAEPEQYSLNVDPATGEIVEEESEVVDNA